MQLKHLHYSTKTHEYFTREELLTLPKSELVVDTESYLNFWLFALKDLNTSKVYKTASSPDEALDNETILWVLYKHTIITFNGNNYDLPMIWAALRNPDPQCLNELSNRIITEERQNRDENKTIDHIDIIEVLPPPKASQKLYAGRLHSKRMQSLPYPPNTYLSKTEADYLTDYCLNDLDDLELLYTSIKPQIELRKSMSKQYRQDLRSKSDAQIAEAVIVKEIAKELCHTPRKPRLKSDLVLRYQAPDFLRQNLYLARPALELVESLEFRLNPGGDIAIPDELKDYSVRIGNGLYRMGIGGLHSSEKSCYHIATEDTILLDRDVASYYPRIILNGNLYPEQLTSVFLKVYNDIVERRLKAKREGDKVTADALKITINGSFGKFGSPYSKLYSPNLLLAVTITGQLSLLLFIEMLESYGIPVVSANTDGIVIKCPVELYDTYLWVTKEWESITSFETEETRYKAIYSRDVNNYFAIKEDGVKGKGFFSTDSLKKNPKYDISKTAVIELMKNGTPLIETIKGCRDIRQFLSVRNVKGGAHKEGWYLGKAVRWYYAVSIQSSIRYITSGNMVPETEGAKPLMELPDELPIDIDYNRYIIEAEKILDAIGYRQLTLF